MYKKNEICTQKNETCKKITLETLVAQKIDHTNFNFGICVSIAVGSVALCFGQMWQLHNRLEDGQIWYVFKDLHKKRIHILGILVQFF